MQDGRQPFHLSEKKLQKCVTEMKPREQEILIAGMLSKSSILDLLKNYVIYETVDNKR